MIYIILWLSGSRLECGTIKISYSKLLGVSYNGFEEAKKGGSKANTGARELRRLECSINYDGRKKDGEKGYKGVEGVNLLSLYEA